jgi:lipopolysaccharide/colanic/teichoic acid biosynthesis glycosyltransferase
VLSNQSYSTVLDTKEESRAAWGTPKLTYFSLLKFEKSVLDAVDSHDESRSAKVKLAKRIFDIVVSSLCILLVFPLFLLIALAIKLESRGPVLFVSKRAGAGYRIFNFYKFRTMQSDADQQRDHLKTLNSYYAKQDNKAEKEPFFFKVSNDPRVTRVGKILRKTSVDELPQLFNVLKGDMSLVGNRPLPLDEGATLTIDNFADRFLAPAGITGLWQIAKNKDDMSVAERIRLDIAYANNSSFALDMRILLRTIPAMLQRE